MGAVALVAAAACGSSGGDGGGGEGAGATTTTGVTTPVPPSESCFWSDAVTAAANNTQYPDSGAAWFSSYTLPEGATLRLTGCTPTPGTPRSTPTARPDTGVDGVPVAAVADVDLAPDEGSSNLFVVGADRTVAAPRPTPSTSSPPGRPVGRGGLGSTVLDGGAAEQQLIYRVYVPDDGRDVTGDGGLPEAELVLGDGTVLTVRTAAPARGRHRAAHRGLPSLDEATHRDLVALGDPATHPAFDPVEGTPSSTPATPCSRPSTPTPPRSLRWRAWTPPGGRLLQQRRQRLRGGRREPAPRARPRRPQPAGARGARRRPPRPRSTASPRWARARSATGRSARTRAR